MPLGAWPRQQETESDKRQRSHSVAQGTVVRVDHCLLAHEGLTRKSLKEFVKLKHKLNPREEIRFLAPQVVRDAEGHETAFQMWGYSLPKSAF